MKQPTTYAKQLEADQIRQELELQKQNVATYKESGDPRLKSAEKRVADLEAKFSKPKN